MDKKKATKKDSQRAKTGSGQERPSARKLVLETSEDEAKGQVAVPVLEHNLLRAIDVYRRKYQSTTKGQILGALRNVRTAIEQDVGQSQGRRDVHPQGRRSVPGGVRVAEAAWHRAWGWVVDAAGAE